MPLLELIPPGPPNIPPEPPPVGEWGGEPVSPSTDMNHYHIIIFNIIIFHIFHHFSYIIIFHIIIFIINFIRHTCNYCIIKIPWKHQKIWAVNFKTQRVTLIQHLVLWYCCKVLLDRSQVASPPKLLWSFAFGVVSYDHQPENKQLQMKKIEYI